MRRGDLVRVKISDLDVRNRHSGILLKIDMWDSSARSNSKWGSSTPVCTGLAEVLWDDGPGWIDAQRIESIVAL